MLRVLKISGESRLSQSADWYDINPGKNPIYIIGAGFQQAVLCNDLSSTGNIIKKTVKTQCKQFSILSKLCEIYALSYLNYVWIYDNSRMFWSSIYIRIC